MSGTERRLEGRVALVTGSARGLGRGMACALADRGAALAIHYRQSNREAARLVEELHAQGVEADLFKADLRRSEEAGRLQEEVLVRFGRLDILVNNVGPFIEKPWNELKPAEWEEMVEGNLNSVYYLCRAFWPVMVAQHWGRIINIGLANSDRIQAYRQVLPYAIAKTGVLILSKSLAVEGAPHHITVNVLAPGLMDNGTLNASGRRAAAARIPAGRPGTAEDLAGALLYLCSEEAAYVTGAHIPVSGGWGL
ncbi:MAG TPA: SDR family oxidoreductase [bacterium]|nr:SDR family oxidoreductase [bacterium]